MKSNEDVQNGSRNALQISPQVKLCAFLQDENFTKRIANELEQLNYAHILTSLANESIQNDTTVLVKNNKNNVSEEPLHEEFKDTVCFNETREENETQQRKKLLQRKKRRITPSRKIRDFLEVDDAKGFHIDLIKRDVSCANRDGKTTHTKTRNKSSAKSYYQIINVRNNAQSHMKLPPRKAFPTSKLAVDGKDKPSNHKEFVENFTNKGNETGKEMQILAGTMMQNMENAKIKVEKFQIPKNIQKEDWGENSAEEAENCREKFNYQCKQCGKHFKTYYTFSIHVKMPDHTKEYPFVCNICGKGFRLSSTLCRHKIIHTNEKPHKCQVCKKTFNRSSTLKMHMRTHSACKQHVCDTCGKGFHQKGNLRNHMFVHSGERPFCCETCGRHFNKKSNLKQHVKIHEKNGKFSCTMCKKIFDNHSTLKDHMKDKHFHY